MPEILSQNEKNQNTLKDFLVPSFAGVILMFLLGTIMLITYSFSHIIGWFGNDYLSAASGLSQNLQVFSKGLSSSFDTALGGRLGQIIVWSFVGALVYILMWFIKNMFNSVENDFIIDRYAHPQSYNRTQFFGTALGELLFFVAMLIVLVVYTYLGLKIILPASASLMSSAGNHFSFPKSVLYIGISVAVPAMALYIWWLGFAITARLWQRL